MESDPNSHSLNIFCFKSFWAVVIFSCYFNWAATYWCLQDSHDNGHLLFYDGVDGGAKKLGAINDVFWGPVPVSFSSQGSLIDKDFAIR